MSRLLIVQPLPIAAIAASRGVGAANLLSPDPKEVWADDAVGASASIVVDLGALRTIDTVFLGFVEPPAAGATWSVKANSGSGADFWLQTETALRVTDVAGTFPARTHALWFGAARAVRVLTIFLDQPVGSPPLTAGVVVIGKAFVADLGQEWGAGRQPIDSGTVTELPSGGFAVVEGARKARFSWTFGDLSQAETDQLEQIALALGETAPGLVIEDADRTAGLNNRIHYGLFEKWNQFERRNRRQTRWEVGIKQWI